MNPDINNVRQIRSLACYCFREREKVISKNATTKKYIKEDKYEDSLIEF